MSKVVYEGWMVRFGLWKIGRSIIHMRYFVRETRVLAYYKRKPQDSMVPIKTLVIDGNCWVEDRGLKTNHGHMVYVLCVYNKKEKSHRITHQDALMPNGNKIYPPFDYKSGLENGKNASSSDREGHPEDEEEVENHARLMRRTTNRKWPSRFTT